METLPELPPLCLPERFAESWINAPVHVVCGVRLRPFCSYHRMFLEAFGLPWAKPLGKDEIPATPTPSLLFAAVQICRLRYNEQPDFSLMALAAPKTFWQKLRQRRRLPRGFVGELAAFERYMRDFCAPPELWQSQKARKSDQAPTNARPPSVLAVVTGLMALGVKPAEAWETPEGQAHHYYTTKLWLDGEPVPFISENAETLSFVAEMMRRAKAARAAKKKQEE